jgi:nucleotidyltransferase substrate binding protein (TIGR01987 family)
MLYYKCCVFTCFNLFVTIAMLDYSSLNRAIAQLETSLGYATSTLAKQDAQLAVQFRAASIQAFEFTYELCHKLLKRYLESIDASPTTIDAMDFQTLIRTGAEKGLLQHSWDVWRNYRKARMAIYDAYISMTVEEIFKQLPSFLKEAMFLSHQLENKRIIE